PGDWTSASPLLETRYASACPLNPGNSSPRVESYGAPSGVAAEAIVEHFSLGETSIVHHRDRMVVLLDISTVELPPLCQFVGLKTDTGGRVVDFERFECVGVDKLQVVRGPISRVRSGTRRLRSTHRQSRGTLRRSRRRQLCFRGRRRLADVANSTRLSDKIKC